MRKLVFSTMCILFISMVLIIVNVLISDGQVKTLDTYIKTIIPGVSTIEDVAILDPDVYDKIDYYGNITSTKHLTEDTGEPILVFYDFQFCVTRFQSPTLNPELYYEPFDKSYYECLEEQRKEREERRKKYKQ